MVRITMDSRFRGNDVKFERTKRGILAVANRSILRPQALFASLRTTDLTGRFSSFAFRLSDLVSGG